MSDDALRSAIETMVERIAAKETETNNLKRAVNHMCAEMGEPPRFEDVDDQRTTKTLAIRADQYYGKGVSTAAREYLERRGQACKAEEIEDALSRGGFDYSSTGWKDWKNQPERVRLLAITLAKNSAIFHKLPNGTYGLKSFYPELKKAKIDKPAAPEQSAASPTEEDDDAPDMT